ncbi:hypothetical protein TNCV_2862211 [Trichonephila clavipes]|nr:hypothetical protein TNCV_2862211 [Trichonephila clavipes]
MMPTWLYRQDFAKFSFNRHYSISSGLWKPTNSKLLTKINEQTSRTEIPKKNTSKMQDVSIKSNQKGLPVKGNIAKSIAVSSSTMTSKLKDSVYEKNKSEKEETEKKEKESKEAKDYNVKEDIDIPLLADSKNITFQCEISHIEPVEEVRKSFAPDGFKFHPPIELNSSLFLNEGPSSIFTRIKNEHERTSTPKQKTVNQQQTFSENNLCTTEEHELLTTQDEIPSNAEQLQSSENGQICSNGLIPVKNNGLTSKHCWEPSFAIPCKAYDAAFTLAVVKNNFNYKILRAASTRCSALEEEIQTRASQFK